MPYLSLGLKCEKCGKKERFEQEEQGERPDVAGKAEKAGWVWIDAKKVRCPECAKRAPRRQKKRGGKKK